MMGNMMYYVLIGAIGLVSALVSGKLKKKFAFYSKVQLRNGLTGKEIAEKMLADHGITDVEVISTRGQLTDHYNPANKTVNLSEVVYGMANASAAAVAAHEVGHAVQHATAYSWLQLRSKIVPAVGISSKLSNFVIMAGLVLSATGTALGNGIFLIGILLMFSGLIKFTRYISPPCCIQSNSLESIGFALLQWSKTQPVYDADLGIADISPEL